MSHLPVRTILRARAPSNIAIVKYMGKRRAEGNLPANGSVSMTLSGLCTQVDLELTAGGRFEWLPERPQGLEPRSPEQAWRVPDLSEKGVARFVRHAERVAARAPAILDGAGIAILEARDRGASPGGILRSANSFPAGAGIASSASSFAALTLAVVAAQASEPRQFVALWSARANLRADSRAESLRRALAALSREGSGSSCRSLEGPWVGWEGEVARTLPTALEPLQDLVLVVEETEKTVSSSEAHQRVLQSPLWPGRPKRADRRFAEVAAALAEGDFDVLCAAAWTELWEMHSLFHTSHPPFSYWEPESLRLLKALQPYVQTGHPTLGRAAVTMDAGANVHVLVRARDADAWYSELKSLAPGIKILRDPQGIGATLEIIEGEIIGGERS